MHIRLSTYSLLLSSVALNLIPNAFLPLQIIINYLIKDPVCSVWVGKWNESSMSSWSQAQGFLVCIFLLGQTASSVLRWPGDCLRATESGRALPAALPLSKPGSRSWLEAGVGDSESAANSLHCQETFCFWDGSVWVAEIVSCGEMLFKREQIFTTTTT